MAHDTPTDPARADTPPTRPGPDPTAEPAPVFTVDWDDVTAQAAELGLRMAPEQLAAQRTRLFDALASSTLPAVADDVLFAVLDRIATDEGWPRAAD